MLFSPIFFGLSYIFGGILNSLKRFAIYSLAPLVYNLSIILGTIFLTDKIGIYGIAIAYKLGWRWKAIFDLKDANVRRIGKLMFPRAIGLGANQILLLAFTSIASVLSGSAVAVYNLA